MLIRYVESDDRSEWYRLDKHLPENGFEEKVNNKQGYLFLRAMSYTADSVQQ